MNYGFGSNFEDNKNNFGTFAPIKPFAVMPTKKIGEMINKKMEAVTVPEKPQVDLNLNPVEWIKAKFYEIKTNGEYKMLEAIKKMLVNKILQWILKLAGGVLVGVGIDDGTTEKVIGGAVVFVISAVWSLITTGKIALTDPSDFLKLK